MIGWIDASSGASGDMLLGRPARRRRRRGVHAPLDPRRGARAHRACPSYASSAARLWGNHALVEVADSTTPRGLRDVVSRSSAPRTCSPRSSGTRSRSSAGSAAAEAAVHGVSVNDVHFHEVGALDAIADIVGVCAGFVDLGLDRDLLLPRRGRLRHRQDRHGEMSVPPPAVANLLRGVPTYAGPAERELCTPTGAALLSHWVTDWGNQPMMTVDRIGTGCGTKDFGSHANVVRHLRRRARTKPARPQAASLYETNVDDLDPRLWPEILQRLLDCRRIRRVADADPDEEGPSGIHLVGAAQGGGRRGRTEGHLLRDVRHRPA